jgi:integrase
MATKKVIKRPALTRDAQVRALKAESQAYEHSIAGARGLLIRVSPKGLKTWVYRYRRRDTKQLERMSFGRYPETTLSEARTEIGVQRAIVESHSSARDYRTMQREESRAKTAAKVAKRKRSEFTVKKLVDTYVEHVSTPSDAHYIRTWGQVRAALLSKVIPVLGDKPAVEVTRKEVIDLIDGVASTAGVIMANRTAGYLSRVFNWAVDNTDELEFNPIVRIPRRKETPKKRNLSDAQLRVFLANAPKALEPDMADFYMLELLTGLRPGEVAGLLDSMIDVDDNRLTLPHTKNQKEHVLPLSKQAMAIVQRRCATNSPPLFPRTSDARKSMATDTPQRFLRDAMPALKVEPFTCHDLRRTCATQLATLQAPRFIVERVLNHTDASVTGSVYDQYQYLPEMREWLQKWADHLDTLKPAKKAGKVKAA